MMYIEMPDRYAGRESNSERATSPFIFHKGMSLSKLYSAERRMKKNDIMTELLGPHRIDGFQLDILHTIHHYACLNGFVLRRLLWNTYNDRNFDNAINGLVKRGLLMRRHIFWDNGRTPCIYTVPGDLAEHFIGEGYTTNSIRETAEDYAKLIARNQFLAAIVCRDYYDSDDTKTYTMFGKQKVPLGMSVIIKGGESDMAFGKDYIRLIPVVVRRCEDWETRAETDMIKALCYKDKLTSSYAVYVCEDDDQKKILGKIIQNCPSLRTRTILCCDDYTNRRNWNLACGLEAYWEAQSSGEAQVWKKWPIYNTGGRRNERIAELS